MAFRLHGVLLPDVLRSLLDVPPWLQRQRSAIATLVSADASDSERQKAARTLLTPTVAWRVAPLRFEARRELADAARRARCSPKAYVRGLMVAAIVKAGSEAMLPQRVMVSEPGRGLRSDGQTRRRWLKGPKGELRVVPRDVLDVAALGWWLIDRAFRHTRTILNTPPDWEVIGRRMDDVDERDSRRKDLSVFERPTVADIQRGKTSAWAQAALHGPRQLTARQKTIVRALATGASVSAVAAGLRISPSTVYVTVHRLRRRFAS